MSDSIDRQAAIDVLKGLEFCHYMEFGEYIGEDTREVRLIRAEKAQDALQNLPPAQPAGHWIFIGDGYKCSECGSVYSWWADSQTSNYCPNCGADMREGEADG